MVKLLNEHQTLTIMSQQKKFASFLSHLLDKFRIRRPEPHLQSETVILGFFPILKILSERKRRASIHFEYLVTIVLFVGTPFHFD